MGYITRITHKEEKRDIIFELFFRNARGDLCQLVRINRAVNREEAAVPLKANIARIILLEEVAC